MQRPASVISAGSRLSLYSTTSSVRSTGVSGTLRTRARSGAGSLSGPLFYVALVVMTQGRCGPLFYVALMIISEGSNHELII